MIIISESKRETDSLHITASTRSHLILQYDQEEGDFYIIKNRFGPLSSHSIKRVLLALKLLDEAGTVHNKMSEDELAKNLLSLD